MDEGCQRFLPIMVGRVLLEGIVTCVHFQVEATGQLCLCTQMDANKLVMYLSN